MPLYGKVEQDQDFITTHKGMKFLILVRNCHGLLQKEWLFSPAISKLSCDLVLEGSSSPLMYATLMRILTVLFFYFFRKQWM